MACPSEQDKGFVRKFHEEEDNKKETRDFNLSFYFRKLEFTGFSSGFLA